MEKLNILIDEIILFLPKAATAAIVLVIGWRIINFITSKITKILTDRKMDPTIKPFLSSMIGSVLKVLLVFSAAEMVGIKTASFVAIFAAASFALGMALQGSLSHFASGILLLVFKPYKVGDIIKVADEQGKVEHIEIFNTILRTPTNQKVIVPNGIAMSDKIINHSANGHIRVDRYVSIPYEADFGQVRSKIMDYIKSSDLILDTPQPSVDIESYDSHNIQIGIFVFAKPEKYWDVYYEINNNVKRVFGESNFKMAYSEGVELGPIGKES